LRARRGLPRQWINSNSNSRSLIIQTEADMKSLWCALLLTATLAIAQEETNTIYYTATVKNTAVTYVAGDALGGMDSILVEALQPTKVLLMQNLLLNDSSNVITSAELWVFSSRFTPTADSAAWAPTWADRKTKLSAVIPVSTKYSPGALFEPSVSTNLNIPAGTKYLYYQWVIRNGGALGTANSVTWSTGIYTVKKK
jgi:hypothetical protein